MEIISSFMQTKKQLLLTSLGWLALVVIILILLSWLMSGFTTNLRSSYFNDTEKA
jgi:hypothetical protein